MSRNNKKGSTTSKRKASEATEEGESLSGEVLTQKPKTVPRGPAVKRTKAANGEAKSSEVAIAQKIAAGKRLWIDAKSEERSLNESSIELNDRSDVEDWIGNNLLIHRKKGSAKSRGGRFDLRVFKDKLGEKPEGIHPLADRVALPLRFQVKRPHQLLNKPKQFEVQQVEGQPKPVPKKNDMLLKPFTSSLPLDFIDPNSEDHVVMDTHQKLHERLTDYFLSLPVEDRIELFGPLGSDLTKQFFEVDMQYWKYPISNWGDDKDRWDLRIKFDHNNYTKQPNYVCYDLSDKNRKMKQPPMISPNVIGDGAGLFGTYVINGAYVMQDWKKPLGSDEEEYQGFYAGYTASWLVCFHLDAETMRAKGLSKVQDGNDKLIAEFKKDGGLVQKTLSSMWEALDEYAEDVKRKKGLLEENNRVPVYEPPKRQSRKGKEKETYDDEELEDMEEDDSGEAED